jgi:hypothetical protein
MKVFISWSGNLAKAVAQLLNSWLPDVIQGAETWISAEDIEKGSIWFGDINDALKATVGILCVTRENKDAPWLLFEAGALSKGLTKSRVCPLLIDLQTRDLPPPLSLFNLTLPDKEDVWKLIKTINGADGEKALPEDRLKKAYALWWPEFEKQLAVIRKEYKPSTPAVVRSTDDMIVEILEISRAVQRNIEKVNPGVIGAGTEPLSGLGDVSFLWEPRGQALKFVKTLPPKAWNHIDVDAVMEILRKNDEAKEREKQGEKKTEAESSETAPSPGKK